MGRAIITPLRAYMNAWPRPFKSEDALDDEARLRYLADVETRAKLQGVDDAHAILCQVCIHFDPYFGWNLWRARKEWNAYRKALHASDYLWARGMEVLKTGGRRNLPEMENGIPLRIRSSFIRAGMEAAKNEG